MSVPVEMRASYPQPGLAETLLQNLPSAKAQIEKGVLDTERALRNLEMVLTIEQAAAAEHSVRPK